MDPIIGGALISAGSSLAGNLLSGGNNHAGRDSRQATSYANRSAILDKVAAAKEAGISPLYALGAPAISVGAQSVGESPGLGQTLSEMGHDVGRAVAAGQTDAERAIQALTLEKAKLENDYLRANIASIQNRTRREAGPPLPPGGSLVPENIQPPQRTTGLNVGRGFQSNPYFSDAQSWEDRYGDSEILSTISAIVNTVADGWWNSPAWVKRSMGGMSKPHPQAGKRLGRYGYY